MKKLFLGLTALLGLLVFNALAADVTGKWTAEMPGRGGQTMTNTFNFTVSGDKLTGTVSNQRGDTTITDGKVSGDSISFVTVMSYNGNEVKINYTGKVEGDTIKMTRQREGGEGPKAEFVAKKAQ